MSDTWTIVWKEFRDVLFPGGKLESFRSLIFLAILGVLLPLNGKNWLTMSTGTILMTIYVPFVFILNYVGDAFAGERERHTLETLLASRISDQAILWGKVIATVGYTWGMVILSSLLGAVVANLAKGQGTWSFYTPVSQWLLVLVLSLLASLLAASGGILVSLHSATVRQAQQTMVLSSLVLGVAIFLLAKALPLGALLLMSFSQILMIVVLVLVVIDAILLAIALASFHRARLILN